MEPTWVPSFASVMRVCPGRGSVVMAGRSGRPGWFRDLAGPLGVPRAGFRDLAGPHWAPRTGFRDHAEPTNAGSVIMEVSVIAEFRKGG